MKVQKANGFLGVPKHLIAAGVAAFIMGVGQAISPLVISAQTSPTQNTPSSEEIMQRVNGAEAMARQALLPTPAASPSEIANLADAAWGPAGSSITARLQKALDDPAIKIIDIPAGTFTVGSVNLDKAQNKIIRGQGTLTTLVWDKAQSRPAFISTSGGNAQKLLFTEFILDMQWQPGDPEVHAFQITNGRDIQFYKLAIKNVGQAGILAQGYGAPGRGTPNLLVLDTVIENTGLADKTTGFGILVKDNSPGAMIVGNRVTGIKGGMGIGAHATTLGGPTEMTIIDNHIEMVRSTTNFEGIGLTKGADNAVVARNVSEPSFDNGISLSSNGNLAVQNYTSSAWNHGLALEGRDNILIANEIGPIGLQNAALGETLEYGALTMESGANNLASGNVVNGGDMAYAVKFNGQQLGNNRVGNNQFTGFLKRQYNRQPLATDVFDDAQVPRFAIALLSAEERRLVADTAGPSTPQPPAPDPTPGTDPANPGNNGNNGNNPGGAGNAGGTGVDPQPADPANPAQPTPTTPTTPQPGANGGAANVSGGEITPANPDDEAALKAPNTGFGRSQVGTGLVISAVLLVVAGAGYGLTRPQRPRRWRQ